MKQYKAWELLPEEKVFLKSDVDEAIAELKDKLQLDEDEMTGFLQLEEECGGGDLRNYIAELKAENKMLKEHIANGDVSRITWIDEATELKAENERLKDELNAANKQCENLINSATDIMLRQDKVNDSKCTEIESLKRALWIARAELCRRLDVDRYLRNHRNSWYNENCLTWAEACVAMEVKMCKAENKCRAKAKEYK